MNRPYTFINVAMTADGKIDTFERKGAAISSKQDKQRVDELRAAADAVLVGGRTLLEEQPKLTVKSGALREMRIGQGRSPNPIKVGAVTVADIPKDSDFIKAGDARLVIFTTSQTSRLQLENLRALGVEVFVDDAPRVNLNNMMLTLKKIGVDHLMVEGGGTQVLAGNGRVRGPGHNAILKRQDGTYMLVHHFYDAEARGIATLQIRPLTWEEQGWPVAGEAIEAPR